MGQNRAQAEGLLVPRRRVAVRVQLADQSKLAGEFYADDRGSDGTPGRVVDRLNDSSETYVPLALENRHVLLNKAGIVTVQLPEGETELPPSGDPAAHVVRISLCDRTQHEGEVFGVLPFTQRRALDYLNNISDRFLVLKKKSVVTLINSEYVMGVVEVVKHD